MMLRAVVRLCRLVRLVRRYDGRWERSTHHVTVTGVQACSRGGWQWS